MEREGWSEGVREEERGRGREGVDDALYFHF